MKKQLFIVLIVLMSINSGNAQKKWNLQSCIHHALENNTYILNQKLNAKSAEQEILTAKGNFYPSLNASASQNFNFGSYIDNYGGRVSRNSSSNSFGINSGVTLFNGQRNKNNLKLVKNNHIDAQLNIEQAKNNTILNIINLYLSILLNKEAVTIAKEEIAITEKNITLAKELVKSGVKPKATLLEAEATLEANRETLVNAENNISLAKLNLAQALQLPSKNFDIEDLEINIDNASLTYKNIDVIYEKALTLFPEIKRAELAVENSELSYKIAKAGYYPTLSLGAGVGTSYQHILGEKDTRTILDKAGKPVTVSNGFGKQIGDNFGYNVGLSLNVPIFNGFRNKSNVAKAKIRQQQTALQLIDQKLKLQKDIETAYTQAKASLNQFVAAKKSLSSQNENFKNATESYNAGIMTSFEFEQIRNRMVKAKSSMLNAKYNYVFKTKVLEYYYGIPITIE